MIGKIKDLITDIRTEPKGMLIYQKNEVYKMTNDKVMMQVLADVWSGKSLDYLGKSKYSVLQKIYLLLIKDGDNTKGGLSYPLTSSLRINNSCNFKCIHCYVDKKQDNITLEQFRTVIKNLNDLQIKLCILTGGETLLHPQLFELLDYAKSHFKGELILNTNGYLLNKEKMHKLAKYNLKHLHISLDGSKTVHDSIRGQENSYDKVIECCKLAKECGVQAELLYTVMKRNLNCVPECINLAKKFNIKISFKRLIPSNAFIRENLVLSASDVQTLQKYIISSGYSKAKIDTCYCDIKSKFKGCLLNTRQLCSIDTNGNVFLCPFLHERQFWLGNIYSMSLRTIYDNYHKNPKFSFKQSDLVSPCNTCSNYKICSGGCRADAFYRTGNYLECDSLCFKMEKG